MDWCNHGFEDPKTTYPLMSKALNASKRHIHFNMCEWGDENPWEWGDPIAQSWRMHGDHVGTWESTAEVIAASAAIPRQYSGRPYGWNDMDMLEVSRDTAARSPPPPAADDSELTSHSAKPFLQFLLQLLVVVFVAAVAVCCCCGCQRRRC